MVVLSVVCLIGELVCVVCLLLVILIGFGFDV